MHATFSLATYNQVSLNITLNECLLRPSFWYSNLNSHPLLSLWEQQKYLLQWTPSPTNRFSSTAKWKEVLPQMLIFFLHYLNTGYNIYHWSAPMLISCSWQDIVLEWVFHFLLSIVKRPFHWVPLWKVFSFTCGWRYTNCTPEKISLSYKLNVLSKNTCKISLTVYRAWNNCTLLFETITFWLILIPWLQCTHHYHK